MGQNDCVEINLLKMALWSSWIGSKVGSFFIGFFIKKIVIFYNLQMYGKNS
jgi:hypothetical protein